MWRMHIVLDDVVVCCKLVFKENTIKKLIFLLILLSLFTACWRGQNDEGDFNENGTARKANQTEVRLYREGL